jgi:hypothetical protein
MESRLSISKIDASADARVGRRLNRQNSTCLIARLRNDRAEEIWATRSPLSQRRVRRCRGDVSLPAAKGKRPIQGQARAEDGSSL